MTAEGFVRNNMCYNLYTGGPSDIRQPVPIAHLVGGEFLPALRNLLQRCPADKLRSGGCTSRPAFNGKDVTSEIIVNFGRL